MSFGPNFIDFWLKAFRRLDDGVLPKDPVGTIVEPEPEIVEPEQPRGIQTVGAWAGSSSLRNPTRDVDFCKEHNINRIDVIVNDHSAWREPKDFTLRNDVKLVRLADLAHQVGIEVHLMSWCMPHEKYIVQSAEQLIPLAKLMNAKSIQWDAEEPWTKARKRLPYKEAATILKESFENLHCDMGVNGIGYASVHKLGPLISICSYAVPQAYATVKNGMHPKKAPQQFHNRWRDKFSKPIVMGLAAYRQKGIVGHTQAQAITAGVEGTNALGTVDTIIYWSLYHIRKNKEIAGAVKNILAKREVA